MVTCNFGHILTEKEWGEKCPYCQTHDEFYDTYTRLQREVDPIKPAVLKDLKKLLDIFEQFNEYCDSLNRRLDNP